jgi:hypothetical protein
MVNILNPACGQVVDRYHVMAVMHQQLAQMTADEPRPAGN